MVVAAAIIKPWQPGRPTGSSFLPMVQLTPPPLAATATPMVPAASPTIDPLVAALQRGQCHFPRDWHVITAERHITRDTRTLFGAEPVHARGPTDPTIGVAHLYAAGMKSVGICVPRYARTAPVQALLNVRLWQIGIDGTARQIDGAVVLDQPLYDVGEAYWAPPHGGEWPPGRYVFQIASAAGPSDRWIGLEFSSTVGATSQALP